MAFDKNYDHLLKVLVTGDSSVDKTSLISQFVDNEARPTHTATFGIDFKMKVFDVNGKRIKLQIWDTAGQERFETLSVQYYRKAQGIVLVYDVTNEQTFRNVTKWIRNIKENALESVKVVLVGNKVDLIDKRVVSAEQGMQLAKLHGCSFFETSALTGENVANTFTQLAMEIIGDAEAEHRHCLWNKFGMKTLCVLSGTTQRADLIAAEGIMRPHYVAPSVVSGREQ